MICISYKNSSVSINEDIALLLFFLSLNIQIIEFHRIANNVNFEEDTSHQVYELIIIIGMDFNE